jgi:tRNA A37 N6-isopentenylltransferase MiaA
MRVLVPVDVLIRELDGESVVLNLKSERYFGLDEVGTRIWTALSMSESIQSAYELLLCEYEVDAERLRLDLQNFVEQMVEHGLVEVSN